MNPAVAIAVAGTFVWLGMVMAISFLEAPLKFRASGVTVPIGLGIGRLVFRALNIAEAVLAAGVAGAVAVGQLSVTVVVALTAAVAALVTQLVAVRPLLTRRSQVVLAGGSVSRSSAHHVYVAIEVIKVIALTAAGLAMLADIG